MDRRSSSGAPRKRNAITFALLPALLLVIPTALAAVDVGRPGVGRRIPYAKKGDEARTLDLYLPDRAAGKPPLLAFVLSQFWTREGDQARVDARLARPLQSEGAAVAVIRHRLAPEHRHPDAAEDVAAAVAWLVEHANDYGYDPERVVLGGHGSGAHLAALVALDPRYLDDHDLAPEALHSVLLFSGVYDLDPGPEVSADERAAYEAAFGGADERRKASPLRLARADAPPFRVLVAQQDIPGYVSAGLALSEALREAGHRDAETHLVPRTDHASVVHLESERGHARLHSLDALGLAPLPPELAEALAGRRYWRDPALSTEPFWELGAPIDEHPADERFVATVRTAFVGARRRGWTAERFYAIDLFALLDALGDRAGSGRWLVTTNARQEKLFHDLDALRPYRPAVVVGVDEERNLFRVTDIYRRHREYTWRDDRPTPPPLMARPLGAFVYFLREPTPDVHPGSRAQFSLTLDSFARSETDPFGPLRDVGDELFPVLTRTHGCVYCHSFRGVGTRSGHLKLSDGTLHGGFALALEEYPPEVLRRFLFDQEKVAAEIGAIPNAVGPAASMMYELISEPRPPQR